MSLTDQWQRKIIDSWEPGRLILTSGGRLARQLHHRYRLLKLDCDHNSWRPLEVCSLNRWLHQCWQDLWESKVPAGPWLRMRLWQEVVGSLPPPADLPLDLALCQALDQTFTVLVRHQLDPAGTKYPSPLLTWRGRVCREFATALSDKQSWHPAQFPMRIAAAIDAGRLSLPDSVMLVAFEAPAPIEKELFRVLEQKIRVAVLPLPQKESAQADAVTLPDQEQEMHYLGQTLLHACQQFKPGAIGVVVPNLESYAPALRKTLNTLLGQPSTPQEETFNVTLGGPLLEHPLVQAALLPLRLQSDEEKRSILISLLLSPYYLAWAKNRQQLARLDRLWRQMSPEANLDSLYARAQSREPELMPYFAPEGADLRHLLAPFRQSRSSSVAVWKEHLERLWDSLQFPVLADESDRIAYNHLKSALANLAADLGSWPLDAPTFTAWFRQALAAEIFQVGASEQAGVQVMGLIESRGLAFKRLFLVGMTSTALPQPVRPLPFLEFEERRQIIGATLKSQYNFARAAFHHLMAAAPEIILTKPDEVDGEPVSATPFWPTPWQRATINFWDQPDAAWSRVEWLRSTWRGLSESHLQESAPEPLAVTIRLPESLSVSSLAVLFHCPFRFLIQELLGLKPLTEPMAGIRPEERGQRLHKVLACVTRGLRQRQQVNDLDWQRVLPTVQACVDEVHADVAAAPPWQVERRRWLGDELGLLRQWFHQELHHLEAGWRWLAEEIPFEGLSVDGWPTALSGRIDRLDLHPEAGLVCWDYKSGSSPTKSEIFNQLIEPQLPAYLLALLQDLVELPDHQHLQKQPLQAGYITLKSEKDIRLDRLQADADHWQRFLLIWQERLAELGQRPKQGYFDVDPLPGAPERKREQLCTYCGSLTICDRRSFEAR